MHRGEHALAPNSEALRARTQTLRRIASDLTHSLTNFGNIDFGYFNMAYTSLNILLAFRPCDGLLETLDDPLPD
jgi:hypothetical protein